MTPQVALQEPPTAAATDWELTNYALAQLCSGLRTMDQGHGKSKYENAPELLAFYFELKYIIVRLWKTKHSPEVEWEVEIGVNGIEVRRHC